MNNNKYEADSVDLNTNYSGAITSSYDSDWYTFTMTESGYISIVFEHKLWDSGYTYWEMYLYRDDGSTYYDGGSRYWSIPGDDGRTTCNIGLAEGTYYLVVRPYSSNTWSSKTYNFTVNFSASATWESELNNNAYDADPVDLGVKYFGSISSSTDSDWFKVTLNDGQIINIDFSHDLINSSATYWELYLYTSDGSTKATNTQYWSVSGEAGKTINGIDLSAGTYFLVVRPYSSNTWSSKNYSFIIK